MINAIEKPPSTAEMDLNITSFCGDVIRALAGELESTIGIEDAEGYINVVGRLLGEKIGDAYVDELGRLPDDIRQVAEILIDLKRRIGGDFSIEAIDDTSVRFHNTRCPFGERVNGRPSLCMMTTNVFGTIASRACGYARVHAGKSIARGDGYCSVTVSVEEDETHNEQGYEFFG